MKKSMPDVVHEAETVRETNNRQAEPNRPPQTEPRPTAPNSRPSKVGSTRVQMMESEPQDNRLRQGGKAGDRGPRNDDAPPRQPRALTTGRTPIRGTGLATGNDLDIVLLFPAD